MTTLNINEKDVEVVDPIVSGRDLIALDGHSPASDFAVIIAGGGTAKALGLDEKVEISELSDTIILITKSDCLYRATVNEREFEWASPTITAANIRHFSGIDESLDIVLDSNRDRVLSETEAVKLSRKGVERFRSQEPSDVKFYVNGTEKSIKRGKHSFADLVKLAFPGAVFGQGKCYTVGWDQGSRNNETGELFEGDTLRIIEGIIIDVSATDKS